MGSRPRAPAAPGSGEEGHRLAAMRHRQSVGPSAPPLARGGGQRAQGPGWLPPGPLSVDSGAMLCSASEGSTDGGATATRCAPTGPCVHCDEAEKASEAACALTGYHQPVSCLKYANQTSTDPERGLGNDKRKLAEEEQLASSSSWIVFRRTASALAKDVRRLRADESVSQTYETYRNCLPSETGLSVLSFEALVLLTLGICGPLVYHRRRRTMMLAGMTRVPSSTRF
eukprot:SM000242S08496  [mRNA]  locus=s242:187539:189136:- [translate_table: standard]